ncbi:MAG: DUF4738 domain-containing protein [Prevotella sp.]|nr:DUF4738 domain-containing protein [Prevotella sp.]
MKSLIVLFAAGMMLMTGCSDKKPANKEIITTDYEAPKPKSTPISMSSLTDRKMVEWVGGKNYEVIVTRMAIDSLPKVIDEIGQKYVDNVVKVKIVRSDSTSFFERSYSKSAFVELLDEDYRQHALLEGIRFLKAEDDVLTFVAWFNYPEAGDDEDQKLRITINRMGDDKILRYSENDRDDLEQRDQQE